MSEKFTASNGHRFESRGPDNKGREVLSMVFMRPNDEPFHTERQFAADDVQALREFFLHERDQELGRWRWPENPDLVVQTDKGGERAWVVNERNQQITGWVWRVDLDHSPAHAQVVAAARAYFAAHPEPKPWHDAKPGEVWLITDDRQKVFEMTCVDGDGGLEFFTHHRRHSTLYTGITAGRMIWPEAVES